MKQGELFTVKGKELIFTGRMRMDQKIHTIYKDVNVLSALVESGLEMGHPLKGPLSTVLKTDANCTIL